MVDDQSHTEDGLLPASAGSGDALSADASASTAEVTATVELTGPIEAAREVWGDGHGRDTDDGVWADDGGDAVTVPPALEPGADPWVRTLLIAALSLVAVLLITTGSLYIYLATLNHAPRTLAELEVAKSEEGAKATPKSVEAWRALAYAYASAGRYDYALDAAAKGEKLTDGELMYIVYADVLRFAGRVKESVPAYDTAEERIRAMMERMKQERGKVGIGVEIKGDYLFDVYWGRGLAKQELGDKSGAIKDLEKATKEDPLQTDVWVTLGGLYSSTGQTDKAKKAYETALIYVPDLPAAKRGLQRLGKGE